MKRRHPPDSRNPAGDARLRQGNGHVESIKDRFLKDSE